jgi:hypothetical protein
MTLPDSVLSVLVLVSLGLWVLAAAVLVVRALGARGRPRPELPAERRLQMLLDAQGKALRRLEGTVREVIGEQRRLGRLAELEAVRHVGVVRFDAFEDMGGRLSFSAAILDGRGDGVVITSINGRQDTRCYAKPVRAGNSAHHLTDEEREAIRRALEGDRQIAEAR